MNDRKIKNPIIPGFYPDPSICRVGEDYYLVCSSFEMYPGIPIFHSKDLANWEQIGYAMTKENGFHVNANVLAGGVMAPTIRYSNGYFYIINANFGHKGNFIVKATDPAGHWSDPYWLDDVPDIDASLFFDDDGKVYIVNPSDAPHEDNKRGIFLQEFDIENMKLVGERKQIWNSALRCAASPEAPHIYHIGDYYYLLIAEGGTEHYHAVTVARAKNIDDWYEGNPANPVITHRHFGFSHPIDNIGHADLVDTPNGNWYAVMLASRTVDGFHKNLGRETYICPVIWERDWPVFSPETGKIEWEYPADDSLPWTEFTPVPAKTDFDEPKLGYEWSLWGAPYQDFYKIENSYLSLQCLARPIASALKPCIIGSPDMSTDNCVSFVCRRQVDVDFQAMCKMKFNPNDNEAAGLAILQASNHQYRLEKRLRNGKPVIELVLVTTVISGPPHIPGFTSNTTETVLKNIECTDEEIILGIKAQGQKYDFYYGIDEDNLKEFFLNADGALINPEIVGGMIGTIIGMFATGNGKTSQNKAYFDWFIYN